MDPSIQRALNDKLYDKRKVGALEYVFPLLSMYKLRGCLEAASCNVAGLCFL